MGMSKQAMDDIMLADAVRYAERRKLEESAFTGSRASIAHGSMDRKYMAGMGLMPQNESKRKTPNREPRYSYTNTDKCEGTSPNMLVTYADGTQAIVPATSTRTRTSTRTAALDSKIQHRNRIVAADLPAIGNIE